MSAVALVLYAAYLVVGFGLRMWLQWRRTADSGFRGFSGRLGSAERWSGALFAIAVLTGIAGPICALSGLPPLVELGWWRLLGAVIAGAGIVGTFLTQLAMGASWRIGVDQSERTGLVTSGPFTAVRNPIFTAMAITTLGLTLMVPNVVSLTGFGMLLIALQLQVRVVEEPYLLRTHGSAYAEYAARTGRFLPGMGRKL